MPLIFSLITRILLVKDDISFLSDCISLSTRLLRSTIDSIIFSTASMLSDKGTNADEMSLMELLLIDAQYKNSIFRSFLG